MNIDSLLIESTYKASLSQNIQKEYNTLIHSISQLPAETRVLKKIEGTGGLVSVNDIIAYQIGWMNRLLEWYEAGLNGKMPVMPGDGFNKWQYTDIAKHFYKKYGYTNFNEQDIAFKKTTEQVIEIVEQAHEQGTLDKSNIWQWTTLQSGKSWPLSKWVQINTVAPFKKATTLIRRFMKQT